MSGILTSPVARVYAEALLQLAEERGILSEASAELEAFRDLWRSHPDLAGVLTSPRIPVPKKIQLLDALFKEGLSGGEDSGSKSEEESAAAVGDSPGGDGDGESAAGEEESSDSQASQEKAASPTRDPRGARLLQDFLGLLSTKGRTAHFESICSAFFALRDYQQGISRGRIVYAEKFDDTVTRDAEKIVSEFLDKTVTLESEVDPEILGGAVVQVEDLRLDGSLRRQLDDLRRRLA